MARTNAIDNTADVLDSLDVIARLEELESLQEDFENLQEAITLEVPFYDDLLKAPLGTQCDFIREKLGDEKADELESAGEHFDELEALKKFVDDASGAEDWEYGAMLIRRSYFVEYCEQLGAGRIRRLLKRVCEDIGDLPPRGLPHHIVVDWEATAKNLEQDYWSAEFDGVEYLYR